MAGGESGIGIALNGDPAITTKPKKLRIGFELYSDWCRLEYCKHCGHSLAMREEMVPTLDKIGTVKIPALVCANPKCPMNLTEMADHIGMELDTSGIRCQSCARGGALAGVRPSHEEKKFLCDHCRATASLISHMDA